MSNNLVNQSTKAISTNELRWIGPVLAVMSSGPMDLFLCLAREFRVNHHLSCKREDFSESRISDPIPTLHKLVHLVFPTNMPTTSTRLPQWNWTHLWVMMMRLQTGFVCWSPHMLMALHCAQPPSIRRMQLWCAEGWVGSAPKGCCGSGRQKQFSCFRATLEMMATMHHPAVVMIWNGNSIVLCIWPPSTKQVRNYIAARANLPSGTSAQAPHEGVEFQPPPVNPAQMMGSRGP